MPDRWKIKWTMIPRLRNETILKSLRQIQDGRNIHQCANHHCYFTWIIEDIDADKTVDETKFKAHLDRVLKFIDAELQRKIM